MRKLLVLALVLGIAALANAQLSIAYDGEKISVNGDEPLLGIVAGLGIIGPAEIGELTYRTVGAPVAVPLVSQYTGAEATEYGLPYDGGLVLVAWGDPVVTPNPAGMWFTMDLAGYTLGTEASHTVQVDLTDGDGVGIEGESIYLVPEPMTMLLLGLGGLFLRKR